MFLDQRSHAPTYDLELSPQALTLFKNVAKRLEQRSALDKAFTVPRSLISRPSVRSRVQSVSQIHIDFALSTINVIDG